MTAAYFWCRWKGTHTPISTDVVRPERCLLGQEVTLTCSMEGKFPKNTTAMWERVHGEEKIVIRTDRVSKVRVPADEKGQQSQGAGRPLLHYQGWRATEERSGTCLMASLTFTPAVQDDGVHVRCSFHHKTRRFCEQRESWEIRLWARPQVSEIQVLPQWKPRDQVPFAVQIQNFYPKEIHQIQWHCDGTAWDTSEPTQYSPNQDLTFNAISVLRVPSERLNHPDLRVRVSIQQSHKDTPMEREIRVRDTGLLRPPEVSEICKPESVMAGEETTLSCCVVGHFPGLLNVSWLRRDRPATTSLRKQPGKGDLVPIENSPEYRIDPGALRTKDGKSFHQETTLSFTPSMQRDQGAEYVCRVGHIILETSTERSSGELQVTVPQPPVLGEISQPQVLAPGTPVTLSCRISRFYPKELSVTWYRKGRGEMSFRPLDNSDTHKIVTSDPKAAPDKKSYSVASQLSLTPLVPEDNGAEYRCHVRHGTLGEPKTKSIGPLELQGLFYAPQDSETRRHSSHGSSETLPYEHSGALQVPSHPNRDMLVAQPSHRQAVGSAGDRGPAPNISESKYQTSHAAHPENSGFSPHRYSQSLQFHPTSTQHRYSSRSLSSHEKSPF
uniref:Ig-like domain-containing protein n=1 Tax=Pelusios castaneus TaxID=367368 RepID=A0A8C8RHL9_9SAUR